MTLCPEEHRKAMAELRRKNRARVRLKTQPLSKANKRDALMAKQQHRASREATLGAKQGTHCAHMALFHAVEAIAAQTRAGLEIPVVWKRRMAKLTS